jgi:hypothetical protein
MLRVALMTLTIAFIASAIPAADTAAPASSTNSANAPVVQPDKIPGKWKIEPQPLPPLDEILKRPPATQPPYGLYIWADDYIKYHDDIRKVGWRCFRVGGDMDDEAEKAMAEDGVSAVWAVAGPRGNKKWKNRADYPSDEAFIADFLKNVEIFLTRYGPGGTLFKEDPNLPNRPVLFVEIWNEPNGHYMIPDSNDRPKDKAERDALYAKVLPAAYDAIKKKWPTVQVVGFSAAWGAGDAIRFIGNVFAKDPARIAKSFDFLSVHPYQPGTPPDTYAVRAWGQFSVASGLKDIRDIMAKYGAGDRPVWYTECGWPISKADGGAFEMSADATVPPLLQAAYVCRMYAMTMRLGVREADIMYITDADKYNAGFFTRSKVWRPSAYAVQTMIKMLPNPKIRKAISDGVDGYYAYECQADGLAKASPQGMVTMAWNVAGPKTVEIAVPTAQAQVVDMLGNEKTLAAKDGKITVEVGPCPVYIRALSMK